MSDHPRANPDTIAQIISGQHRDPFSVLGIHQGRNENERLVRAFVPGAESVSVEDIKGNALGKLVMDNEAGFFSGYLPISRNQPIRYRAANFVSKWTFIDPYSFGPVWGPVDDYLSAEGSHRKLFEKMGANPIEFEGVRGTHFAVWAPNAKRVSVVGEFNFWDGRMGVMRFRSDSGIWEIFMPEVPTGSKYKFEVIAGDGTLLPLKSDPYARQCELRPGSASIVHDPTPFVWTDAEYLETKSRENFRKVPISIYEVHIGCWKKHYNGSFYTYKELGETLLPYVAEMGFTHIELLPISEYPYDPSWGYQPTGLFAPTSRYGTPREFAEFVNTAHNMGIGVILDWVAGHFPTDEHGLKKFDGTSLYEHADDRKGFHPDWNTAIYNFGRREVKDFLLNNALFWIDKFHIDGLRVDAVASMLYLDYSRKEGEWIPNQYGGRENIESIEFLREMNSEIYGKFPYAFTIAEESTSWPMVSRPAYSGGLGFGFKWNMGLANDLFEYLQSDPIHRSYIHNNVTFGMMYAYEENFIIPVSHDEVVHGKGTLLSKIPGGDWHKFSTLRTFFAFMWTYPGKKLLFMGQEFGQRSEWAEHKELEWFCLSYSAHGGVSLLVKDLNNLMKTIPALYSMDCEPGGFEWLIADDQNNSVFAWLRSDDEGKSMCVSVFNFTPVPRSGYRIPLPAEGTWKERLNTDSTYYGGSGRGNMGKIKTYRNGGGNFPFHADITIPPLGALIFEYEGS